VAGRGRAEPRVESVSAAKALGNSSDRAARRSHGAWYTPPALVNFLVEVAKRLLPDAPPDAPLRILDPSCGDGRVLAACKKRWPNAELHGWDIDPAALAEAAAAIPGARLVHRDVLGSAGPSAPSSAFDLVIGNPPFLGQLRGDTVLSGDRARALRARFPGGIGAYTDTAAMFLRIAADLAPTVVLVQPVSTLASRDAAPIRAHLAPKLAAIWVANAKMFPDALVDVCVIGLAPALLPATGAAAAPSELLRWCGPTFTALPAGSRLGAGPSAPDFATQSAGTWSPLVPEGFGLPAFNAQTSGTLGDLATATADFRDEYYALSGLVREALPGDIPATPCCPGGSRRGSHGGGCQRCCSRHRAACSRPSPTPKASICR
jgi:SAM-dependent methyltransferase